MTPPQSPNSLGAAPRRGLGVRRLNRAPLVFAFAIVAIIVGAVMYTYQSRLADKRRKAAEQEAPAPADAHAVFRDAPGGFIPANTPAPEPKPDARAEPLASAPLAVDRADEEERQRLARRRAAREQAALQAIAAPTAISQKLDQGSSEGKGQPSADAPSSQLTELYAADAMRRRQRGFGEGGDDLNQAEAKRRFLSDGASPQGRHAHYLAAGREAPLSPYEVKAGTVIPAVMIGGVSSDLPGQLIGQVSENVYDTATGRFILIPQGSRLVGAYDNGVTSGQERVLVAWTRILYPDASSLDLGKTPGADESGAAGFHDQVNDHFWKMFGSAAMMSLITGGVQLSQGQGNNAASNGMNAQQTLSAALGQQMGQLGAEIARRTMHIQPTLEIRPGYRFVVMVTRDIVARPWRPTTASPTRSEKD